MHKISQNLQIFAEIYRKVRDFAVILPTQKTGFKMTALWKSILKVRLTIHYYF